ncbi:MAG: restriction endonuclease subunit S [Nitrospinales bacterium]
MSKVRANLFGTSTLSAIRDTLLPKLLSGEIRVKDAEKFVAKMGIPIDQKPSVASKPGRPKAPEPFREAILIATLVRELSSKDYPLGRKRYTKFSYLVHRKSEHEVEQSYLKKAAGVYNPGTRYKGPEGIALQNGYIIKTKSGKYDGFRVGPNISKIDEYLPRYDLKESIDWVIQKFRRKKNEELGLLTTVDFVALELKSKKKKVTSKTILSFIKNDPDWKHKHDDPIYSELNVKRVLKELKEYFPETYDKL